MKDFKTANDWTRNKNSEAVVYANADGSSSEITLGIFLKDSPHNTPEMFRLIKRESDKLYQKEDIAEGERGKNELPLLDWSEKSASKTLEEQCFDSSDDEIRKAYLKRRRQMLALVPAALETMTENQRRRFCLHKAEKLTTRKIAAIERVSQASVHESICGAEKKIENFLKKNEKFTRKYPVKRED